MIGLLAAAALAASTNSVAASSCELHLFGRTIEGAPPQAKSTMLVRRTVASNDPLDLINVMSPQNRMAQVSDAKYRSALNIADNVPVARHWDVVVDSSVRKTTSPLFATPLRCHVEVIGYSSAGMAANRSRNGKNDFVVSLLLREFAPDGSITFQVDKSSYGEVDTEKKHGRDAALQSLQQASDKMIDDFGKQVAKQREKSLR